MKKIYSLLAAGLLASGLTASADEISFTIKVNEPGKVTYSIDGSAPEVLTEEETVFTYDDLYGYGAWINLGLVDNDYFFKSVTDASGAPAGYMQNTQASLSAYNGGVYTVDVYDVTSTRTASFTLNVDDPDKVVGAFSNGAVLNITSETQVVKFNPEEEAILSITGTDYTKPLYKVTVDGAPVDGNYGTFDVPLTDGCVVDVEANYPDILYTVTLLYGEGADGFFTRATIDGTPVEDFDGRSFQAQVGSVVQIYGDTQNYIFENITVNGKEQTYFYGNYRFNIMEDTEILVNAHKAGNVTFTINVNNPEYVSVFQRDYNWNKVEFELNAGDNVIELPEKACEVNYEANPGCYIVSVTDQTGEEYENDNFIAKDGYTYTIVAEQIAIDQTAVVYVDDPQEDWWFSAYYDTNVNRDQLDIKQGYNVIPFGAGLNPFSFTWYGAPCGEVYVNEELVEPMYPGASTYYMDLDDKDVVKIFLAEAPTACDVTFDVTEGVEANVVRDIITEVADYAAGFTAFNGTQVNISGEGVTKVSANGEEVAAEDGNYTVIINADTEIAIDGIATGVAAIGNTADAAVYNLQGVKVGTRASVKSLPAGIYVVEGRKVTVK